MTHDWHADLGDDKRRLRRTGADGATWRPEDIIGDLHTRHEVRALFRMCDQQGRPRRRYAGWTVAEVRAHIANVVGEARRATSHGTGATP